MISNEKPAQGTALYGVNTASHDFDKREAWGKNIFTNTMPVALAQYMDLAMFLKPVLISAEQYGSGRLSTRQSTETSWQEIIKTDPMDARFLFEYPFDGFKRFTRKLPEKSDVVVTDSQGNHTRALEIKLTVVPDNNTRSRESDKQACEIVVRPPTIEQLAYSICASFGESKRQELNELILRHVPNPQQFRWSDEKYVIAHFEMIKNAVSALITNGIDVQEPLVLNVIWRTEDASPELQERCFEVFVWTNFAFLVMFLDAATGTRSTRLTRPQRSLVWLVKLLYDYSSQAHIDRADVFTTITYGAQSDKAGAFNGSVTHKYLGGKYLSSPRIGRSEISNIVIGQGAQYLAPERRLDAAIYIQLIRDGVRLDYDDPADAQQGE